MSNGSVQQEDYIDEKEVRWFLQRLSYLKDKNETLEKINLMNKLNAR